MVARLDLGSESAPAQTTSLYRKYRPQSFDSDELVGQDHVVRTLRNAIRRDRVAHAYLFCGPRGTGKTTTARLLAKAVNCLEPDVDQRPCNQCAACVAINSGATTDVIEIDAASNRGIDDIRDLRERVKFAPTQLKVKFYIIDEAHQITGAAANAFLKTLEEPPPHTKFILATTDPEELLPTIVSRCQRFDFRRVSAADAQARIRTVAEREGIAADDEAVALLAELGRGSLRDALGMLDQLASYEREQGGDAEITAADVRSLLGMSQSERVVRMARAIAERDPAGALAAVHEAVADGQDPRSLNRQLTSLLRELMQRRAGVRLIGDETSDALAQQFELNELLAVGKVFTQVDFQIRNGVIPQLPLELALVEAILALDRTARFSVAPAQAHTPQPAPSAPRSIQEESAASPPPETPRSSLRDRVRGSAPVAPPPSAVPTVTPPSNGHQPPEQQADGWSRDETSSDRSSVSAPAPDAPVSAGIVADASVAWFAERWGQVRGEVKVLERRVEALLSSVDPVALVDDLLVLAAAYPFHRDQLNRDEKREVVERVVSRIADQPIRVTCILRGEPIPGASPSVSIPTASPTIVPVQTPAPSVEETTEVKGAAAMDLSPDELRRRAALQTFDGEIIEEVSEDQ